MKENVLTIHCKAERSISMEFSWSSNEAADDISGDWLWRTVTLLSDEFPQVLDPGLLTGKTETG